MQKDAVVFVCGNASTMAPGVRAALVTVFRAKTGTGASDGEAWLAGLRTNNRYLEDIWARRRSCRARGNSAERGGHPTGENVAAQP
jgi:hypothetical protein